MRARFLMRLGRNEPAAAGGTATLEFSDDFNRANNEDPGNGWTENGAGGPQILGNALVNEGGSANSLHQSGTPLSGVGQFAKITASANDEANTFHGFLFRVTDATSPHYGIYWNSNPGIVEWYRGTNLTTGLFDSLVQDETFAFTNGSSVGVTVKGTGTNVVVRVWLNPTGSTPDAGGTTWGSASPTVTMSDNPATPVDTGNIVGISCGGTDVGDVSTTDDFFAGTVT